MRRFGWLLDHVKADTPEEVRANLLHLASRSRKAWLGPASERVVQGATGFDKTWRPFVNVPREELHDSAGLGQRKNAK